MRSCPGGGIGMLIIRDARLAGEFFGYAYGRCYQLTDDTRLWQQVKTDEPVYLDRPWARLFFDEERKQFCLQVEDTSGMIPVVLDRRASRNCSEPPWRSQGDGERAVNVQLTGKSGLGYLKLRSAAEAR